MEIPLRSLENITRFHNIYKPITATPFASSDSYTENRIDSMVCGIDDRSFSTYDKNDKEMEFLLFDVVNMEDRSAAAEKYLWKFTRKIAGILYNK